MFLFCVESSHQRGMGHVFRALVLARELGARGARCRFALNDYAPALQKVRAAGIEIDLAPLTDEGANWEARLVHNRSVRVWVNDRLDTGAAHAARVKAAGAKLVTLDDSGAGAASADLHIAAYPRETSPPGLEKRVLSGLQYLVLDPEIARYRRARTGNGSVVASFGGTDTYGLSVKVAQAFAARGIRATVVCGPGFGHLAELRAMDSALLEVKSDVGSLAAEFSSHDIAVTGAGLTAFEAAAAGLPTLTFSSEPHEEHACRVLAALGASLYLGTRAQFEAGRLIDVLCGAEVATMSARALAAIDLLGARRVADALTAL